MNKLVYANEVKSILESKGFEVAVVENGRNNASNVGISIRKDFGVSPIFYIKDEMDENPYRFADMILSFEPEEIDVSAISELMLDKEEVLNRVHYILVNSALNEKRDGIVRVPINSTLELHYKIDIGDIFHDAQITLEKKHLESLDLPLARLAYRAYHNTMENYEAEIYSLSDILPEIGDASYMFSEFMVLSNKSKVYGAGAILYEGMYDKLQEVMDGDFVVIPSSVHEVILVKTEYGDVDALTKIIGDVNGSVVSPEEVLSDRPYKLVRDKKLVEA